MPNHVANELIFRGVDSAKQDELLANLCDAEGNVDFDILVPAPLNIWCGNVGVRHEEAFKRTHLDWARENWGTKWNAYGHKPAERTADTLTLRFDTAWTPPYPWLAAVFNRFKISFDHNWLSEGREHGVHGVFDFSQIESFAGDPWREVQADDEMQKHLHMLRWGCESFDDEDETETAD